MDSQKRKPLRLKNFDYSKNGVYFVTVCTKNKMPILCKIVGDGLCAVPKTVLSDIGIEVEKSILYINNYPDVHVDKYAVMPNHVHMIISIDNQVTFGSEPSVPEIINRFKSYTTNLFQNVLWQRSYHDHIIRCQNDYDEIWQYIDENPLKWNSDCYYN